jgi:N-acetylglutamate synthase-like GNAT family acetyltransferase
MDIRPFTPADRDACLAVFDSNTPDLLQMDRRPSFAARLDDTGAYFVAEHDGTIVGCGGYALKGNAAHLQWGLVHRQWQRQGLGRFLLFYRLREITRNGAVEMVGLEAPLSSSQFFASQGFREVSRSGNEVTMTKRLTVCA